MMENSTEQPPVTTNLHRVTGLIAHAKTKPVSNRLFRYAIEGLLNDLDTIARVEGPEARAQAALVGRYAQAIIGARYFHHLFPEIVFLGITNNGPEGGYEASFSLEGLDADGNEVELTEAQGELAIRFTVGQIFASDAEFIPAQGEKNSITLNLAALYADHVEPADGSDEVFGLEHIPSDVTLEQVEEATTDGESAISLILGVSNGKHINPIPDSVVLCANAEVVRRYEHDGAPRHINFGLWLNGLLLARAVRAKFPHIAFIEAGLQQQNNKVMLLIECHNEDDELIELDDADAAVVAELARTILIPNPIYGQYVWENSLPIRVEISNMLKSVPGPSA